MKKQDKKQDELLFDNEEYELREKEKARKRLNRNKKKKSSYKKKSVLNSKREYISKNYYDYE